MDENEDEGKKGDEDAEKNVEKEDEGVEEKNVEKDKEGKRKVKKRRRLSTDVGKRKTQKAPVWFSQWVKHSFEPMKKDVTNMNKDVKNMKALNGKIFEQHLYKHAGRTLGFISLAYEQLKFQPLYPGLLHLESYLMSTLSVSRGHALGKDKNFDWLKDYQHANYKGKLIKLETYNFNLVTTPIYNSDGKSGPHIVIGEVKVEGSIYHLAKGLLQCTQLAGLVLENVQQIKTRHKDLKKEPRLKMSFFLFVICGYFNDFPRDLRGLVELDKLKQKDLAKLLNLNKAHVTIAPCSFEAGVSDLWNCFVLSQYKNKTLREMYDAPSPNYGVINSFILYMLIQLLFAWGENWEFSISIGFIEGKL